MSNQLTIRGVPDHLLARLRMAAAREHRSLNGQVLIYIEDGVATDEARYQGDDQDGAR